MFVKKLPFDTKFYGPRLCTFDDIQMFSRKYGFVIPSVSTNPSEPNQKDLEKVFTDSITLFYVRVILLYVI